MLPQFARTPPPPYYVAIFTSQRSDGDQGYAAMASRMSALACTQAGYLGAESCRDANGFGITVSYWESEAAIAQWGESTAHLLVNEQGRTSWYTHFDLRIAKVERAYGMVP